MNTPTVTNIKKNSGNIGVIIVALALFIALVFGAYFFFKNGDEGEETKTPSPSPSPSLSPSGDITAPQTDASQEEVLQTLFKTIDKDNNNVLSFDEMFSEMGPNDLETNTQLFNSLDTDQSSSLSMAEFTSGNIGVQ